MPPTLAQAPAPAQVSRIPVTFKDWPALVAHGARRGGRLYDHHSFEPITECDFTRQGEYAKLERAVAH